MKYLLIALALLPLSCAETIIHKVTPAKRLDIDSSGSRSTIRSLAFDCSLFLLSDDDLSKIEAISSNGHTFDRSDDKIFFLAIVRNHDDLPISIPEFYLQTGKEKKTAKQLITLSPDLFRTFPDIVEIDDFTASSISYRFSFILPDDAVACIGSIPTPFGFENFSISLSVPIKGKEKIIAFDYTRSDYRQNGGSY